MTPMAFLFSPIDRRGPLRPKATGTVTSHIASDELTHWPREIEITTNSSGFNREESFDDSKSQASMGETSDAWPIVDAVSTVPVQAPDGPLASGYDLDEKSSLVVKFGFRAATFGWIQIQIQSIDDEESQPELGPQKSGGMITADVMDAMDEATTFEAQLACLLEGFRDEVNARLRYRTPFPRLPSWWLKTDTQTGASPHQHFMESTLHAMLDQVFDKAKERIISETSSKTCDKILHVMRDCDGVAGHPHRKSHCGGNSRPEQRVTAKYGPFISVEFSW
jgi:hypothetical protein